MITIGLYYRPQRSCGKVMFNNCLILFTGGIWQTPPPPVQTIPPQADTTTPPQETATAADGTHPTRMHSCSRRFMSRCNLLSGYY